jgi:hypothetical protein
MCWMKDFKLVDVSSKGSLRVLLPNQLRPKEISIISSVGYYLRAIFLQIQYLWNLRNLVL